MPKNNPMHRTVSIAPAMYIQVAAGFEPALTKNSSVAGTVILPTMCGMKNTAQMMRRILNSLSRLNLWAGDMADIPPVFLCPPAIQIRTSLCVRHPLASFLKLLALEPSLALGIKRCKRRPVEPRKLVLDRVTDLALPVREGAIAFRKLRQVRLVEREPCIGLDRVDAVFLVGKPPQHDAPAAFSLFQKIIEASAAHDDAQHALDLGAVRARHIGLRDRSVAL